MSDVDIYRNFADTCGVIVGDYYGFSKQERVDYGCTLMSNIMTYSIKAAKEGKHTEAEILHSIADYRGHLFGGFLKMLVNEEPISEVFCTEVILQINEAFSILYSVMRSEK